MRHGDLCRIPGGSLALAIPGASLGVSVALLGLAVSATDHCAKYTWVIIHVSVVSPRLRVPLIWLRHLLQRGDLGTLNVL